MKKILLSFLVGALTVFQIHAQISEGHINYKIDMTTDDPQMQMMAGMLQGSTLDIYFKEKMARTEMKMGTMMTTVNIINEPTGEMLMLMSGMMGKKAIKSNLKDSDTVTQPTSEVTLVDETKEIIGFKCKKAIITDEEGNEMVTWYTTDFVVVKKGIGFMNDQIPGVPLEFDINRNGLKMNMSATKVDKKLDKKAISLFDMKIPDGYTETTMEELQMMGG